MGSVPGGLGCQLTRDRSATRGRPRLRCRRPARKAPCTGPMRT